MQSILREKLIMQAIELAKVSEIYYVESQRFVDEYFRWIEVAEKDLAGLRSPISILLSSEKSSLNSVMDGYRPNHIQTGNSIRKIQKALAAQSLEKISNEIYSKIENIDRYFDQINEKLCHAIAVLASKEPEIYAKLGISQQWANTLWDMLGSTQETIPMYNYFCAKLALSDRNYLLFDIIQKIVSNRTCVVERNPLSY